MSELKDKIIDLYYASEVEKGADVLISQFVDDILDIIRTDLIEKIKNKKAVWACKKVIESELK